MFHYHIATKAAFFFHFPTKQSSLGGLQELQERKNQVRAQYSLPPLPEDTYEVCRSMRPASPPASAADLIEQQVPRRGPRAGKRVSQPGIMLCGEFIFCFSVLSLFSPSILISF